MAALNIVVPKTNNAGDQQTTDELNQRNDGPDIIDDAKSAICSGVDPPSIASDIADDAESVDWGASDPPPPPKPREPKEIVGDLKKLVATDREKYFELAQEQIYTPPIMLSLAGDFAICFGGPGVVREPMSLGSTEGLVDSREIHPALSSIAKFKDGKYSGKHSGKRSSLPFIARKRSSLPSIVFDIGRLHQRISDRNAKYAPMYEMTDYRVFMDVISRAMWLFYEYYEGDDDSPRKFSFQRNPLTKTIGKKYDAAIALQSIENWDGQLTVEVVNRNIKNSCFMSHSCIAPALSRHVEDLLEASRKNDIVPP